MDDLPKAGIYLKGFYNQTEFFIWLVFYGHSSA